MELKMIFNKWEEQKDGNIAIDLGKLIIDKKDLQMILSKRIDIRFNSSINNKIISISHFLFNNDIEKEFVVDHIDGNSLNNTKKNLRKISRKENSRNKRPRKNSKSKYKGVSFMRKHWYSQIYIKNKNHFLGYSESEIEAAKKYDKKAKEIFGEYAYLNFPELGQEKYEQKLTWEENKDNSVSIDFGKLIIDKEDLEKILKVGWNINMRVFYDGKFTGLHKIIFGPKKNKSSIIDHINGNQFDNRKCNLRECTKQQNNFNRRSRINTSSKYKGVYFSKKTKKWNTAIRIDGKVHFIGCFNNEIEAAKYYDIYAKYFFGEYARLNFPKIESSN